MNFLKNQVTFQATRRSDDQPWIEKPITLQDGAKTVSPFVPLVLSREQNGERRDASSPVWPGPLGCSCQRYNEAKGQLTGEEFWALIRQLRACEPKESSSVLARLRSGGKIMHGT